MNCIIIGNGKIKDYDYIKSFIGEDDYIICADGGYNHAKKMGIAPDIIIGDMDSVQGFDGETQKIDYPCEKDFTDGELCVEYAKEKGFSSLLLLAMTSERLDHTISNILMLAEFRKAKIIDDENEIFILKDSLVLENKKGRTLSIIPVYCDLLNVTTRGLKYPLKRETLYFGKSRGNSNIISEDKCEINIEKGIGIVIVVR